MNKQTEIIQINTRYNSFNIFVLTSETPHEKYQKKNQNMQIVISIIHFTEERVFF